MTLAEAASLLGQNDIQGSVAFEGISIDTRKIQPGNLFIAIKGDKVDGHDFLAEAREKGASAALVSHQMPDSIPQLVVSDVVLALGKLGAAWRDQFKIPFLAVTGSNGKTTLKNMIASILVAACQGDKEAVLATQGNLNNHIGLPLTLARLNKHHRYAVIEMGMNHFGEIDYLTQLTRPDVAAVNNAGAAHLEGVGDLAGVAKAKAEIFAGLSDEGIAILNRDDAFFTFWHGVIGNRHYLTFGFHPDADVKANLHDAAQTQHLTLDTPQGQIDINLPLLGKHNILNALAASASAIAVGIELTAIKAGLESILPAPGRLQLHTLSNGVKVIDDTYNANPVSLLAAVDTLAAFPGKRILVLGDLKELGEEAKNLHKNVGEKIRAAGIDFLFTYGELSANTAQAFGEGAYHFSEQEQLVTALKPYLYNQTTILVKGSRSMRMEKVVAGLVQPST